MASLRPAQQRLPLDPSAGSAHPTNYLQLFRASAARYCPGLSWTVLAAIGQIESGDGRNMGPSSAGALGPMQFLPSTWREWGITAFGQSGPPDIMNPFDAVPAAARLLCAAGAGSPRGLYGAVFAYNHADLVRQRGAGASRAVRPRLRLTRTPRAALSVLPAQRHPAMHGGLVG